MLLSRFDELAQDEQWATLLLELQPKHNSDVGILAVLQEQLTQLRERLSTAERVRNRIGTAVKTARGVLKAEFEGITWSLDGYVAESAAAVGDELLLTVERALSAGLRGLVLLLDEAQAMSDSKRSDGDHPLSTLISAVSTLQKREVPIALVPCGLPTLAVNLLAARTYSERMFKGEQVTSLEGDAARDAFTRPLDETARRATPELVDRVLKAVEGYPYFIQLWGAEIWDMASFVGTEELAVDLLESARDDIYRRLDLDFYEPRIESLTPAEQDLLIDSSRCNYPPLIVSELGGQSKKSPNNVNVLLGRLVTANVLYRERKGQYKYTDPGFHDYLQRRASS